MQSLKDRLKKIESLLKTAGILNEADLHGDPSDDEDELHDEDRDVAHQRSGSVARSSDGSYASLGSPDCEAALFPGGGDLEATPLFRQHERDDSRYFGELPRDCSVSVGLTQDRPLMLFINSLAPRN